MEGTPVRYWSGHRYAIGDVVCDFFDRTGSPEIVIQRSLERFIKAEENMDSRTLNIAIHNADPVTQRSKNCSDVGRRIALTRATTERMNGDHSCHAQSVPLLM